MKSKGIFYKIVYSLCLFFAAIILITLTLNLLNRPVSANYSDLYRMIELKNVQNIIVSDKEITFSDLNGSNYIIYRVLSDNVTDKLYSYSQPYTILENRHSFVPVVFGLLSVSFLAFIFSLRKIDDKNKTEVRNIQTKQFIINDDVPKQNKSMYRGFSRNVSLYSREENKMISDLEPEKIEEALEPKELEVPTPAESKAKKEDKPLIRDLSAKYSKLRQREALMKYKEDSLLDITDEDFQNVFDSLSEEEYSSMKKSLDNLNSPKSSSDPIEKIKQQETSSRKSNFSNPSESKLVGRLRDKSKKNKVTTFNDEESFYEKQKRGEI